jgi:hypothetical protein
MLHFGKIRTKQVNRPPRIGSFAIEGPELKWESCRENFSRVFPLNKGMFFSHEPNQGEKIAIFIDRVEQILCLKNKTAYAKTNLNFVLWLNPSDFWKECPMKRSLFTVLLRAALKYDPLRDNFQEALLSNSYIVSSKNAVYRFLFGFTKFQGDKKRAIGVGKGWVSYFKNKSDDFVCTSLVAPRKKKQILAGNLWS